jgi:hypothetical protein
MKESETENSEIESARKGESKADCRSDIGKPGCQSEKNLQLTLIIADNGKGMLEKSTS